MDHRAELADFLKARRAAVSPADVGLAGGGRRRTAGLRREEVALLAGVSVSWYTWLEQGRPVNPSAEVLDSLGRVLRLDAVEQAHLHALAGQPSPDQLRTGHDVIPDEVALVLRTLDPAPAYVIGRQWDILAWNEPQGRLVPALDELVPPARNLMRLFFLDPAVRLLVGDWEAEARHALSQFRAETLPWRQEPSLAALIEELLTASPEFAAWWPRHDVAGYEPRERVFHHPTAGELRFGYLQLVPAGAPDLRIVCHLPLPGDDSAERLRHHGRPSPARA